MNKFYYNTQTMNNSWFNNSDRRKIVRVEDVKQLQLFNKELAAKVREHLSKGEIGIFIEDNRNPISSMLSYNGWLNYKYFDLLIEGKDHCNSNIKYRFIIGVSDFVGNTQSLERIAFHKLQQLLMTEGIGCLKTDIMLSEMQLKYEDIHG